MAAHAVHPGSFICVTGGSSFVGTHIIQRLLNLKYRVRTTVHDSSPEKMVVLEDLQNRFGTEALEIFEADLDTKGSFDEALDGCEGLCHIAAPFRVMPATVVENDIIRPSVDGTLNILDSCSRFPRIRRIVLQSSCLAVANGLPTRQTFDEREWGEPSVDENPFEYAKTLAERAAWDFAHTHAGEFDIVSLCTPVITGPNIGEGRGGGLSQSTGLIWGICSGNYRGPNTSLSVVDIRDFASSVSHLFGCTSAYGRYLCCAASTSVKEIAKLVHDEFPRFNSTPLDTLDDELHPLMPRYSRVKLLSTGFKFNYDIGTSIRDQVEWLLATGHLDPDLVFSSHQLSI